MVFACNTLSCHDNHLCQTIFKSHDAGRSRAGQDSGTHKHKHTHGQVRLHMPIRDFTAGAQKKIGELSMRKMCADTSFSAQLSVLFTGLREALSS